MKKFEEIKEKGVLSVLSGKWFFSSFMTLCLYPVHLEFSKTFLALDSYTIDLLGKTIEITSTIHQAAVFRNSYIFLTLIAIFIMGFVFYRTLFDRFIEGSKESDAKEIKSKVPDFPFDRENLQMIIGLKHNKFNLDLVKDPEYLIAPMEAMFQNFLITGTIGMGKTAAVMYSFLKQALFHQAHSQDKKAGMLILDVKGNFYAQALEYAKECGREEDVVLIQLEGEYTYNPLHKPNMEPVDLASRSRSVMDLFSGGAKKEKFWDTKAGHMMTASIRLLRMTSGYVTLGDIHGIVTNQDFLEDRLEKLMELREQLPEFDVQSCLNYFTGEFSSKAENMIESIKGCVTEMTGFFASSERINNSFCPSKENLNFTGFEECINEGKIVVLAMNVAEYPEVSKTIAAYLKLDFQSEVQQRTSKSRSLNKTRPVFFICDEYQEFVTANDARFYGLSRESKCCSIVSSQSYTSILQTLGNKEAFDTLQQNLINKIWLRTDDKLTIDTAQFLTGKEEKEKYSKNISESMSDTKKSKIFGKLVADKSSISESINVSTQRDFVFEEKVFTQTLELFKAICFTANEKGMNEPHLVHLFPYFLSPIKDIKMKGSIGIECKPEIERKKEPERILIKMKQKEKRGIKK